MRAPSVVYVTHPHQPIGVDYWRALNPAYAMRETGYPVATVRLGMDLPTFDGHAPDVLVTSQRGSSSPGRTRRLRDHFCREHGILLVADCCDDPLTEGTPLVQRANRTDAGHSVAELVIDHLHDVDLVTVNSEAMARVVRNINPNVEVMRDMAIGDHWFRWIGHVPEDRAPALTVGVAGGDTHAEDWRVLAEAWPRLAERHPTVHFACVGFTPDYLPACLPADRFHSVGWANVANYQANYHHFDIGCAPLADTAWNHSKSPLKYVEYTLSGAPTVASPTVYADAIRDGGTGLIARTVDEWVADLDRLIVHESARMTLLGSAMTDVRNRWLLDRAECKRRLRVYSEHYRRVYGKHPRGADSPAAAHHEPVRAEPLQLHAGQHDERPPDGARARRG